MSGYTRNGITYNSEDEADLAAAIPSAYIDRPLDAGYIAEAILDSDWLADHDRQFAVTEEAVVAERARQIAKGYTAEHDAAQGVEHLLLWALHYAKHGEPVKSAALVQAARELLSASSGGES